MKVANILIVTGMLAPAFCFAKEEKINWAPCKKELNEYCTTYSEDIEKHECLEEISASKISKACLEFNKKQEDKFGAKGKHTH